MPFVVNAFLSLAQAAPAGGEANLILPDLSSVTMLGLDGRTLLMLGLLVCAAGLGFGLWVYRGLRDLPVHTSMLEVSELIYETCKTYLGTQGKFLVVLELFIGTIIVVYFGMLRDMAAIKVVAILMSSVLGILGSIGVAWFGIRVNTFANSRTAFASLRGKPYPCYSIPLRAGMSIGTMLISVELALMLGILLFVPGDFAGPCFIGFAIGESPRRERAAHCGGHLHQDRRHRRRLDEDRVRHQGGRRAQSRRDRRLHGRQRWRFGRPDRGRLRGRTGLPGSL